LSSDVSGNVFQWSISQGFKKQIIVQEEDGIPISFFKIHHISLDDYFLFLSQGFGLKIIKINNSKVENKKVDWTQFKSVSSTITGIECMSFGEKIWVFVSDFNGALTKWELGYEQENFYIEDFKLIKENGSKPIWGLALSPNKFQLSLLMDVPGIKGNSYSFISKKKTKILLFDIYKGESLELLANRLIEIEKQNQSHSKDDILSYISKLENHDKFKIVEYLENESEDSNNLRICVLILKSMNSLDSSSAILISEKLNKFQQSLLLNYATQKIHKLDDESVLSFCDWILKYSLDSNDSSTVNGTRLSRIEHLYKQWKGNEEYSEIVSLLLKNINQFKNLGLILPKRCKCPICDEEMETTETLNPRKCSNQHPSEMDVLTFKVIENKSMRCTGCSCKCEFQQNQNHHCPLCGNKFAKLSWQ
jgi:hypothetical protein